MYQTHNTKKKQTKRSRCKKKMLEEFFLFLIHFQNILEPMSTCSLIDDIFELEDSKWKLKTKWGSRIQVFIQKGTTIRTEVRGCGGWIRTSDLRLMRTTRWTTSLPRSILFPFLLYIYYNKNFFKSQIFVYGTCGRGWTANRSGMNRVLQPIELHRHM